eukprot:4746866-Pyramimonas_sp.AAC.1
MIVEGVQAPHSIVRFVRRVSTHPTESLTQLLEGVILARGNIFLPALPHAFLIHRAYRWGLPQGKSIPDHGLTPTGEGRVSWVAQLFLGR